MIAPVHVDVTVAAPPVWLCVAEQTAGTPRIRKYGVPVGAPVESMYHWRGQIETAQEVPVTIKTRAALYPRVEAAIRASHPYELPEIVAVPLTHGLRPYLDWLAAETVAP